MAKSLLTETSLPILDIAMAAGFGSVRQFNNIFKQRYKMTPLELRKNTRVKKETEGNVSIMLGYRPPYRFAELLAFFSQRAISGVEVVRDETYFRTVRMKTKDGTMLSGWIKVTHISKKHALQLTISDSLLPVMPKVAGHVKNMFDLFCDPEAVASVLEKMNRMRSGLFVKGTRIPGAFDPFEMSVRAVLGQQITVHAAGVLAGRFVQKYGTAINTEIEGLTHLFPLPEEILDLDSNIEEQLGPIGIISSRARTIRSLSEVFADGSVVFESYADSEKEKEKLLKIKGVGPWTADYIAMRCMSDTDVFLGSDAGVKRALDFQNAGMLKQIAEEWRPWRSYATVCLWNSLQG